MPESYTVLSERPIHSLDAVKSATPSNKYGLVTSARVYLQNFDDAVVYGHAERVDGTSLTGKHWTRWKNTHKLKLRLTPDKNGVVRPNLIRYTPSVQNALAVQNQNFTGAENQLPEQVRIEMLNRIEQHTGYKSSVPLMDNYSWPIARSIYPILDILYPHPDGAGFTLTSMLQSSNKMQISAALREKDIADFTRVAFGKTRYRKDLVKAIALNKDLTILDYAAIFRGLVPTDWIIDILKKDEYAANDWRQPRKYSRNNITGFRQLVSRMPQARRHTLIESVWDNPRMAYDAICGLDRWNWDRNLDLVGSRTFEQIHTALYGGQRVVFGRRIAQREVVAPTNKKLPQTLLHKTVDSIKMDGFKFVTAKDTDMMHAWSSQMNNCIRSYTSEAQSGTGIYIGAYDANDKLVANIELKRVGTDPVVFELRQILGKFNQHLPDASRKIIVDALIGSGIIDPTTVHQAWGMPAPQHFTYDEAHINGIPDALGAAPNADFYRF